MTHHVRHIFTQGDQTEQKIFPSRNQFVNCNISIPSKQNGLLQYNNQEFDCYIPFGVAVLYTLVQNFLKFVALKARKTSSLHTIILEKHKQTKQLVVLIFNQVYFSFY